MADPEVTLIEQTGRTQHTSPSGIEIVRNFHVEPYEAHTTVTKALQGSVTGGEGAWTRTAPARDPWIWDCFCTEAVVDPIDPDAWTSSDSIMRRGRFPEVMGDPGPLTSSQMLIDTLQRKRNPRSGAMITAHYRPMITAWENPFEPQEALDWLDPKIVPGVRQLPWPGGMNVRAEDGSGTYNIPAAVANPIEVPISDFSIRRILVGSVPHDKIKAASGALNRDVFPAPGTGASGGLPRFEPGTLKFEGAEVQNMVSSDGERWYEITYRFKWIHYWGDLISAFGFRSEGWVTWNHVLFCPSFFGLQGSIAWYEAFKGRQINLAFGGRVKFQVPGFAVWGGTLYNETNFAPLFNLN